MNYTIKRDLQEYGPYTLAELQRYVATGNVLLTDLCKSEGMADWVAVSQVIGTIPVPQAAAAPAAAAVPYVPQYPPPPSLHWGLVLGIDIITCFLFGWVWAVVQASWVRKVQPESKAIVYYAVALTLFAFAVIMRVSGSQETQAVGSLVNLVGAVFWFVAAFSMKNSLEEHYNTAEPIALRLSGVMTFFFNVIYFQYHFTEINEMKNRQASGMGTPR
jgi:hypothetical protein